MPSRVFYYSFAAVNNDGNCIALFTSLLSYKLYRHYSEVQKSSQIIMFYISPPTQKVRNLSQNLVSPLLILHCCALHVCLS